MSRISTRKARKIRFGIQLGRALLVTEYSKLLAVRYVQVMFPIESAPAIHLSAIRTITKGI